MGFGLGAFFFNFVLTNIVNPDNVKQENNLFPQDIANNLPFALQILSAIYIGLGIIGVVLSIPHKDPVQANPLMQPEQES
jgi:multisubunit Na+/H+ antiporter MnhC subunit